MSLVPTWPDAHGARVLTLVGNDITIDTRARKTASSLARAGYSVISIGVDPLGVAPSDEDLDGALLRRVRPWQDPRISSNLLRLSRAEMGESLRYRVELQRVKLQMLRRNYVASRQLHAPRTGWVLWVGQVWARTSARLRLPDDWRLRSRRRLEAALMRGELALRFGPSKGRVIWNQAWHQALTAMFRRLARPPRRRWRPAYWRHDLPEMQGYEASIGSLVDALRPDLVHVHDIFHLGLAARAKARAVARGDVFRLLYDAHEYIPGLPTNPVRRDALTALERQYIGSVDAIVTVSSGLADLLEQAHGMRPHVVMNAPDVTTSIERESARAVAGVPEEATALIYVGGIAPHRGADDLLMALTRLPPHLHLIMVSNSTGGYILTLRRLAEELGVSSRVHFVPYVEPEAVVSYIRSADISLISLSRKVANYEIALPNKLFQSIHAGLPVVVSDNPEMARFVEDRRIGEVFRGGEVDSMVEAIQRTGANIERYRAAVSDPELLDELSWAHQFEGLLTVYQALGITA